ncbi:MAG: hypothetical protein HXX18_11505 [Bacteroidetes bacterium]|nr:hypothetical protein [Bacteroidota bacterium]
MLTAIRKSDKNKVFGSQIDKDIEAEYYCEYCGKIVIHHNPESAVRIGHFKHKSNESLCPNITGETEIHYKTKYDIFNYIKKGWSVNLKILELEKWICNNSVRPDIYIETPKGNRIAIEVQATILTVSEIKRRTEIYFNNDIYVLWILPFEHGRIYEKVPIQNDYSKNGYEFVWEYREKVKLKEMEIFLYWAYLKKLLFWDIEHQDSDSFICVSFSEYKGNSAEFIKDGIDKYYSAKTAKTIKSTILVKKNIKFNQLSIRKIKEFNAPFRNYNIPNRRLFTFEENNK